MLELVKSNVAEGAGNTYSATNHPLSKQGVAGMNANQEQWRPVAGFDEVYEVSDQGRVRRLDRHIQQVDRRGNPYQRFWRGRMLTPTVGNHGYPHVNLRDGSRSQLRTVHRLVLEAFVGPCPDGMEACHANDIKTDNRLENLRWDTSIGNKRDMLRNGGHHQAGKTHCKRGHEFTSGNTLIRRDGGRSCRACKRLHSQTDTARANHRERNRRYVAKRRAS